MIIKASTMSNSISENALIAAYARQLPVVPAEIVDDVAREFRLDVVGSAGERANASDMSVKRAARVSEDVVATMHQPANGMHSSRVIGAEAKKHEPYT